MCVKQNEEIWNQLTLVDCGKDIVCTFLERLLGGDFFFGGGGEGVGGGGGGSGSKNV